MSYNPASADRAAEIVKNKLSSLPTSDINRKLIHDFLDNCFSEGLSVNRVIKYLYYMSNIAEKLGKDFQDANRADIERLVSHIERSGYSEWTKHDYKVSLKKFYKWLRRTEDGYPPEVKWIRSTVRNKRMRLPEDLLTPREIQLLIAAATNARDKAIISSLYESGCRVGEILNLRIKQVQEHPHGLQITVWGGMKGARRILLIASASHIAAWLNSHPSASDPNAFLWVREDYSAKPLSYERVRQILRRIGKRAGLKKAVNPHNFRHSRATYLAKHLTEAQMKEYFGWVQGSEMASTYVHLSGRDVDCALLRLHDIKVEEEEGNGNKFTTIDCPRCHLKNPPENRFCSRCGNSLDETAERKIVKGSMEFGTPNEIMDMLLRDPEFMDVMVRKLKELKEARREQ